MTGKLNPQRRLTVRSPFDEKFLAEINLNSADDLDDKLTIAKNLHESFPQGLSVQERVQVLQGLRNKMSSCREEFSVLASSEGGKPIRDSLVEVDRAINGVDLCIQWLNENHMETIPMDFSTAGLGRTAMRFPEPIGSVAAISAFNHPLNLIVHQAVTAFTAGCPVIVKPALETPLSCLKLAQMMADCGCPESWFQVLICENAIAEKLACDPRIKYLSFIGSAKTGWYLRSKIAPGTRCALEHGGLAPAIVCEDADLTNAVTSLIKGSFYHAGQVCVSTQRIFVQEKILPDFLEQFSESTKKLITGDPLNPTTDVGPIIRKRDYIRILDWVQNAQQNGAELICGGNSDQSNCINPTILFNPSAKSEVSTHEIFGPVVCIYPYAGEREAIRMANATNFHFQSAVFSTDVDRAMLMAKELNSSTVMINDHTAYRVDWMPFSGRDESGLGTGGIRCSIEEMSSFKLVISKGLSS